MSVVLQISGNHHLNIDSYESGIKAIEQALDISVHRSASDFQSAEPTNDPGKVIFQAHPHFFNGKIDESSVWLRINHEQCGILRVFKHGFDLFLIHKVNTRYNIWKTLVSKGYLNDPEEKDGIDTWNAMYADWMSLRAFAQDVLRKFGGNQLVCVNDHHFQNFLPELEFGMEFEQALEMNRAISPPIDYRLLVEYGDRHTDLSDWYIEKFDFTSSEVTR